LVLHVVFFYLRDPVSFRDLEEIMQGRGVDFDKATLSRWVITFSPLLAAQAQTKKRSSAASCRVDETYIKVKGKWTYRYRTVNGNGKSLISCSLCIVAS
jgi:putative transposase